MFLGGIDHFHELTGNVKSLATAGDANVSIFTSAPLVR